MRFLVKSLKAMSALLFSCTAVSFVASLFVMENCSCRGWVLLLATAAFTVAWLVVMRLVVYLDPFNEY